MFSSYGAAMHEFEVELLNRIAVCFEPSWLRCHGHSLILSSYLCKINQKENSCSVCSHQLQNLTTHLLNWSASKPLRRAIFAIISSTFDL